MCWSLVVAVAVVVSTLLMEAAEVVVLEAFYKVTMSSSSLVFIP
jgi:hypothetical protein